MKLNLSIVAGVEGLSVYLCGYRIAGSKPWGGGRVMAEWTISMRDIREALAHGKKLREK